MNLSTGETISTRIQSVPIGAQFRVGSNPKTFVRIPEMVLHLPTVGFVVNCVYEKPKDEHDESDMICDFSTPETPCSIGGLKLTHNADN